jgi:rhomboid protease GluP
MFIHFGVIHLALNMYGLYMLGVFLEPMLGKAKFILAYLCTGVFASIASLWWHSEGTNSAGASGAIFGMFGVFLALLLTNLIPKQIRTGLLRSIGIVVAINLIYGMKQGIDNAAHIGGLLSGIIIGFVFYPLLKKNDRSNRNIVAFAAIAGITFFVARAFLMSPGNSVNAGARQTEINALKELKYPDAKEYYEKYDQFADADQHIVSLLYDSSFTYAERIVKNQAKMEQEVKTASSIIEAMKKLNVSDKAKKKTDLLEQLLNARKENFESIKKLAQEENAPNQLLRSEIREKEEKLLDEIKSLN